MPQTSDECFCSAKTYLWLISKLLRLCTCKTFSAPPYRSRWGFAPTPSALTIFCPKLSPWIRIIWSLNSVRCGGGRENVQKFRFSTDPASTNSDTAAKWERVKTQFKANMARVDDWRTAYQTATTVQTLHRWGRSLATVLPTFSPNCTFLGFLAYLLFTTAKASTGFKFGTVIG